MDDSAYHFVSRGKIFVKGLGLRITYFVEDKQASDLNDIRYEMTSHSPNCKDETENLGAKEAADISTCVTNNFVSRETTAISSHDQSLHRGNLQAPIPVPQTVPIEDIVPSLSRTKHEVKVYHKTPHYENNVNTTQKNGIIMNQIHPAVSDHQLLSLSQVLNSL